MKGDFTRLTFTSRDETDGVLQQQGRVELSDDWYEQPSDGQRDGHIYVDVRVASVDGLLDDSSAETEPGADGVTSMPSIEVQPWRVCRFLRHPWRSLRERVRGQRPAARLRVRFIPAADGVRVRLECSGAPAELVVVEGEATIRFGDGRGGARPTADSRHVDARHRLGVGRSGHVPSTALRGPPRDDE